MDPCKFIDLYVSGFVIGYGSSRRKLMYSISSVKYIYFFRGGSPDIRTIFLTVVSQALDSRKINIQAEKHF